MEVTWAFSAPEKVNFEKGPFPRSLSLEEPGMFFLLFVSKIIQN